MEFDPSQITDVESAKKMIKHADKRWLHGFLFECMKAGYLKILSGTDGESIETLRVRAKCAIENIQEEAEKEAAAARKPKLVTE